MNERTGGVYTTPPKCNKKRHKIALQIQISAFTQQLKMGFTMGNSFITSVQSKWRRDGTTTH